MMESVSQLFVALDENYLTDELFNELADDADLLAAKIVALSKSLERSARIVRPSTPDSRPSTTTAAKP